MQLTGSRILIVDDHAEVRRLLKRVLTQWGASAETAASGEAAKKLLAEEVFDLAILDVRLPGISGLELLESVGTLGEDTQVIMMTGSESVQDAVRATRAGAYQYLTKPVELDELAATTSRALQELRLRREVITLRTLVGAGEGNPMIGGSPPMELLHRTIARVAPTDVTVLITGETGTGKELVARRLHALSSRADGPFVPVNLAAVPETLLESTLFGHEKGSFTGALAMQRGLIETAAGGTLFLDEASSIPPGVQVKLLRVLQERTLTRVGSSTIRRVDFRLVAASSTDLTAEVAAGRFREDLYYRMAVIEVPVPPLRERGPDIPLLASYIAQRFATRNGLQLPTFSAAAIVRMTAYPWPGNVRELQNAVERAVLLHQGSGRLDLELSGDDPAGGEAALLERAAAKQWTLADLEQAYILSVLERNDGHRARTALQLGIDRRTLYLKLKQYAFTGFSSAAHAGQEDDVASD